MTSLWASFKTASEKLKKVQVRDELHPSRGGSGIASGSLFDDELENEESKFIAPSVPPLGSNLLVSSNTKVAAWPGS